MNKSQIREFFIRLKDKNPEPKSELEWTNSYTLLIAVVLSAQSTDVGVNKATKSLFKIIKTPQDVLNLGLEGIKEYIKTIGLYNTKAKNIIAAADMLVNDFNGKVPCTREELIKLPGVGRKSANVILNIVFEQPTIAVDTHIFRVSNRTGLAQGKTPEKVEEMLLKVIPDEFILHAHHWLVLHGRYICKARKPNCQECLVNDLCEFKEKTI
ncbi:MAG: endonuclease III [Alphaproteobacteria bacterium]|nr:endonuclease III [Alphaproteobacteria bacterium]